MEAILKFNLPDDEAHFRCASCGLHLAVLLSDYAEALRQKVKHGEMGDDIREGLDQARNMLYELMADENIDLDHLLE